MALVSPFYSKQIEYGGQFIDFGFGWQIPSFYSSVEEEYWMIRKRAGIFDSSFNSSLAIVGGDALIFLQKVLVNDLRKIHPGKAIYSTMVDENGEIVDDATVFWVEKDFFIYNGYPDKHRVMNWLEEKSKGLDVFIVDMNLCNLALQGPKSREILRKVVNVSDLPYLGIKQDKLGNIPVLIARVGWTGELGYEFYISPEYAHDLWDDLIELGKEHNVRPYGDGAAVTAAMEKGYLIGHKLFDFYPGSSPLEVGLGWTVAFDKADFVGKEALLERRSRGLRTKLMGFEVSDPKVVASATDNLLKNGKVVGKVTCNGAYGPTIGRSIGRGWVEINYANEGEELEIEHENKKTKIKLARYRWYDPEGKRVRG
jgi:aminomethyltransferase